MTGPVTLRYGARMRFLRRSVEFEFPDLQLRVRVLIGDQATAKVIAALERRVCQLTALGEPVPLPSFPLAAEAGREVRWFSIRTARARETNAATR